MRCEDARIGRLKTRKHEKTLKRITKKNAFFIGSCRVVQNLKFEKTARKTADFIMDS
jgi:hypothetical protein